MKQLDPVLAELSAEFSGSVADEPGGGGRSSSAAAAIRTLLPTRRRVSTSPSDRPVWQIPLRLPLTTA